MYNLSLWVLEPIVFVLRLPSYHPIPVLRVCRFLKYARPEVARILRDNDQFFFDCRDMQFAEELTR